MYSAVQATLQEGTEDLKKLQDGHCTCIRFLPGSHWPANCSVALHRNLEVALFKEHSGLGWAVFASLLTLGVLIPLLTVRLHSLAAFLHSSRLQAPAGHWCSVPHHTSQTVALARAPSVHRRSFLQTSARNFKSKVAAMSSEESYSIWLMPEGDLSEKLTKEINTLADSHPGAPRFLPHVTLLGDIKQPQAQALATAEALANNLPAYRINFTNVGRGTFYYQCVFMVAAQDKATMEAAALARKEYGMTTGPYMPHLSLLYADLTDEEKDKVADGSRARLFGPQAGYDTLLVDPGFTVSKLTVWSTPTDDKSTQSWCKVAEFPLKGSPA